MSRKQQSWVFFLMAVWITGTIGVAVMATQNFGMVDRLLTNSTSAPFKEAIDKLGAPAGRDLLRYLAAELHGRYFQWWDALQIPLLGMILWLLRPLERGNRAGWYVLGMLAVVLFVTFAITPPIVRIGRELAFLPREPRPGGLQTFGLLHAAYSVFMLLNLILSVLVLRALPASEE